MGKGRIEGMNRFAMILIPSSRGEDRRMMAMGSLSRQAIAFEKYFIITVHRF